MSNSEVFSECNYDDDDGDIHDEDDDDGNDDVDSDGNDEDECDVTVMMQFFCESWPALGRQRGAATCSLCVYMCVCVYVSTCVLVCSLEEVTRLPSHLSPH